MNKFLLGLSVVVFPFAAQAANYSCNLFGYTAKGEIFGRDTNVRIAIGQGERELAIMIPEPSNPARQWMLIQTSNQYQRPGVAAVSLYAPESRMQPLLSAVGAAGSKLIGAEINPGPRASVRLFCSQE